MFQQGNSNPYLNTPPQGGPTFGQVSGAFGIATSNSTMAYDPFSAPSVFNRQVGGTIGPNYSVGTWGSGTSSNPVVASPQFPADSAANAPSGAARIPGAKITPTPELGPDGQPKIAKKPWKPDPDWKEGDSPLEKFGYDLVERAEKGKLDPCVGREDEIRRLMNVLSRRTKNNPVLIGEPGVGKTAIVEGFALRIAKGDVPPSLRKPVYVLDVGQLVAGTGVRGKFEERVKAVLKQIESCQGQVFVFIDEVHLALGTGRQEGAMDMANLMKPMLARGEMSLIGATTLDEYRKHIEKDPAFERRLQPVYVGEPDVPTTVSILRALAPRYERHHHVTICDSALLAAAKLATRYVSGRYNPDKSIDVVDEAAARIHVAIEGLPPKVEQLQDQKRNLEAEMSALKRELEIHGFDTTGDPTHHPRVAAVGEGTGSGPGLLQPAAPGEEPAEIHALRIRIRRLETEVRRVEASLRPVTLQYQQEKQLLAEATAARRAVDEMESKKGAVVQDPVKREQAMKRLRELDSAMAADDGTEDSGGRLLSDRVTPFHVADVVAAWTGVPVNRVTMSERERLLNLSAELKMRVVAQDPACDKIAHAILRSRAGLGNGQQPVGSFLFLGPTGVGKTELARALAYSLFDDERHMVRLDMSEYAEPHSIARMFGSPPGYVGHDAGGQLTEAVRRRPYNVLLFDEIEKAHPQVLNALLQVLDDGRQTDGKGRVVDFTNTVIIMTSNVGSQHLLDSPIDQGAAGHNRLSSDARQAVYHAMRSAFTPEFLNRIDDVLLFSPLVKEDLACIVRLLVDKLAQRVGDANIKLEVTDATCDYFIQHYYSPHYGARPLRRALEAHLGSELARMVVLGQLKEHSRVVINTSGRENPPLVFQTDHVDD